MSRVWGAGEEMMQKDFTTKVAGEIEHRGNFVAIREDFLFLTNDHCQSAVLAVLEQWTNTLRKKGRKGEVWIIRSYANLSADMFGLFSGKRIGQAIKACHYILSRGKKRETLEFRLDNERINADLKGFVSYQEATEKLLQPTEIIPQPREECQHPTEIFPQATEEFPQIYGKTSDIIDFNRLDNRIDTDLEQSKQIDYGSPAPALPVGEPHRVRDFLSSLKQWYLLVKSTNLSKYATGDISASEIRSEIHRLYGKVVSLKDRNEITEELIPVLCQSFERYGFTLTG